MKPFIILIGDIYYPAGWDDYAGEADTLEEAVAFAVANGGATHYSWYQVIDLRTKQTVASSEARS